jgi:hypothetical protein
MNHLPRILGLSGLAHINSSSGFVRTSQIISRKRRLRGKTGASLLPPQPCTRSQSAYLGMQGDIWDAQKDMGAAFVGALITALGIAFLRRRQSAGESM